MIKQVICISGKARSGKDTVAQIMRLYLECKGQLEGGCAV